MGLGMVALCAIWFAVFGGQAFGPYLDDRSENIKLHEYLAECPSDEFRIRFYSRDIPPTSFIGATINFSAKSLTIEGGGFRIHRGLFWIPKQESVYSNVTFPLIHPPASLTDFQINRVKELRAGIALDYIKPANQEWSGRECCVAFYQGDKLQSGCFLPGNAPAQLNEICYIIGFTPILDYWNSSNRFLHVE